MAKGFYQTSRALLREVAYALKVLKWIGFISAIVTCGIIVLYVRSSLGTGNAKANAQVIKGVRAPGWSDPFSSTTGSDTGKNIINSRFESDDDDDDLGDTESPPSDQQQQRQTKKQSANSEQKASGNVDSLLLQERVRYARQLVQPLFRDIDERLRTLKANAGDGYNSHKFGFNINAVQVRRLHSLLDSLTVASSSESSAAKAMHNVQELREWWHNLVKSIHLAEESPASATTGQGWLSHVYEPSMFTILVVQILLMLTLIFFNHRRMSVFQQLGMFFLAAFVLSIPSNWLRLYEQKQSEKHAYVQRVTNRDDRNTMKCVLPSKFDRFWHFIKPYFSATPPTPFTECERNEISSRASAEYQVSPVDAVRETFSQFIVEPVVVISEALSKVLRGLFTHLPVTLFPFMTALIGIVLVGCMLYLILRLFFAHNYRIRLPWLMTTIEPSPHAPAIWLQQQQQLQQQAAAAAAIAHHQAASMPSIEQWSQNQPQLTNNESFNNNCRRTSGSNVSHLGSGDAPMPSSPSPGWRFAPQQHNDGPHTSSFHNPNAVVTSVVTNSSKTTSREEYDSDSSGIKEIRQVINNVNSQDTQSPTRSSVTHRNVVNSRSLNKAGKTSNRR